MARQDFLFQDQMGPPRSFGIFISRPKTILQEFLFQDLNGPSKKFWNIYFGIKMILQEFLFRDQTDPPRIFGIFISRSNRPQRNFIYNLGIVEK